MTTAIDKPVTEYQPYQQRVVEEKDQLDTRLKNLRYFIASSAFISVAPAERKRMLKQATLMQKLSNVLQERIEAFTP